MPERSSSSVRVFYPRFDRAWLLQTSSPLRGEPVRGLGPTVAHMAAGGVVVFPQEP